jgi:hypothetical protein
VWSWHDCNNVLDNLKSSYLYRACALDTLLPSIARMRVPFFSALRLKTYLKLSIVVNLFLVQQLLSSFGVADILAAKFGVSTNISDEIIPQSCGLCVQDEELCEEFG